MIGEEDLADDWVPEWGGTEVPFPTSYDIGRDVFLPNDEAIAALAMC